MQFFGHNMRKKNYCRRLFPAAKHGVVVLWPFEERLSARDGVEKYRRWLRRWLLGGGEAEERPSEKHWWYAALAGMAAAVMLAGLLWSALNARQPVVVSPVPQRGAAVELMRPTPVTAVLPSAGTNQPVNGDANASAGNTSPGVKGAPVKASSPAGGEGGIVLHPPVRGRICASFGPGYSPEFGDYRFRDGVEFAAAAGGPVTAAASGRVQSVLPGARVARAGNGGQARPADYAVCIEHGGGWRTTYRGLAAVQVRAGQVVSAGSIIGRLPVENKEAHLVLELAHNGRPVDPAGYLVAGAR